MPRVEAAVRSHRGRVRAHNEDNFYLNGLFAQIDQNNEGGLFKADCSNKTQIYAVCDGMGGLSSGDMASMIAVSRIVSLMPAGARRLTEYLNAYIEATSDTLMSLCEDGRQAGCTLALIYVDGSNVRVAHLGDSRVYFKRGALPLTQVTLDHSQAEWYVSQGVMTPEQANIHPSRNILRRYIGAPVREGREPDVLDSMRLKRGDVFLLCSDGLSNMISSMEMEREMIKTRSCADICRILVTLALERGGDDNITAMIVRT